MFYSLKSRLITAFILLFVLSFGTLSILLFNESRSIIRTYIESSALEKMEEYGSYISMVQAQVYDLASLVYNSDITNNWESSASDSALTDGEKMLSHIKLSGFLTQASNSYSSVSGVTVYHKEGMWISSDNQVSRDASFLQKRWYTDFIEQSEHWVASHTDPVEIRTRSNPHPVVSMLIPIGTFEPSLARVIMKVNVSASYFLEPLNRIHLGRSGTIYLLDSDGEPILNQNDYETHAASKPAVASILNDWRKQGVKYLDKTEDSADILVYKKLPKTNWMLIGFVTESDLYAELFDLRRSILVFASLLLILSIFLAIWLSHGITHPLSRLVSAMRHVRRGEFGYAEMRIPPERSVRHEVDYVTETFRDMVGQLDRHIKTEFELKLLRQQAEYKALLGQINPHFLFNTLELTSSLAMQQRTDDTVQVIESLGKMMRFSLRMSDDVVRLEEELRYARDYVSILKVRFGNQLRLTLEREGELERLTIIKFILQPLIENAVKYSLGHQPETKVDVTALRIGDRLHLIVADNGPGIPEELRRQLLEASAGFQPSQLLSSRNEKIGLGNVLARCRLYYGSLFTIRIESSAYGGAHIELILPAQEESKPCTEY